MKKLLVNYGVDLSAYLDEVVEVEDEASDEAIRKTLIERIKALREEDNAMFTADWSTECALRVVSVQEFGFDSRMEPLRLNVDGVDREGFPIEQVPVEIGISVAASLARLGRGEIDESQFVAQVKEAHRLHSGCGL